MKKIGKVQFHKLGRFGYFFLEGDFSVGDWLVCETGDYVDMGRLISIAENEKPKEGGSVLRIAGDTDYEKAKSNSLIANQFLNTAKTEASRLCLKMKLVDVAITLDRTHATFFFTAESRVDFRTLVRALAHKLHCRIEMHQIRAREETKLIGGIGVCGQRLCCDRFLQDFKHISVAMAKNQNLNASVKGIKGVCGKLLCCLSYEDDIYREFKKTVPKIGTIIEKGDISGKVAFISPLKKQITIKCQNSRYIDIDPYTFEPVKKEITEFPSVNTAVLNRNLNINDLPEKLEESYIDKTEKPDDDKKEKPNRRHHNKRKKRKKRGKKRR